jgi:Flp pilus assembly protein TadG
MTPPSCAPARAGRSDRGQTLPVIVVFMVSLLGICAMAIDVGNWYQEKRHAQSAADSAALAGALTIPAGTAQATATTNFQTNASSGEHVVVTLPTSDSVQVTVTDAAPSFFGALFGISSAGIQATATAQIRAQAGVSGHVSPYAVLRTNYANGAGTTLFKAAASGQYGTIDLPSTDNLSGGSCSGNTVMGTPSAVSKILSDTLAVGQIVNGGCLSPKPGAAQPSATVVNSLAGSFATDLQQVSGSSQYSVIPQSWDDASHLPPRLIYVPIVDSVGSGNTQLTVTGFAWFYMTGSSGGGNSLEIDGKYVSLGLPTLGNTTSYVPGAVGQVTTVLLTQ